MVTQGDETIDAFQQYYSRPPVLTTKESFTKFLWNPSDRSVFGRTGSSWSKLLFELFVRFFSTLIEFEFNKLKKH